MSVHIIRQGILDTVQDTGRYGFQHLGINPSGAMDKIAMSVANMLVGNDRNQPAVELHFPTSTFRFDKDCLIAITGADFDAVINDQPAPLYIPIIVGKNSTLRFNARKKGARSYLAVHGGWTADCWLGSYSTNLYAQCGGFQGRKLRKNDLLSFQPGYINFNRLPPKAVIPLPVYPDIHDLYNNNGEIRCLTGSEYDWLANESKKQLQTLTFEITIKSDRMGFCLSGTPLSQIVHRQFLSCAVSRGSVQLLPSGQLIVLMADHQTTGGYPKVAEVISADLPSLAQMSPTESFQFVFISHHEAESILMTQEQYLQTLEKNIHLQLEKSFRNAHY